MMNHWKVVASIKFNEVGKYFDEVDKKRTAKILDLVPGKFQLNDCFLIFDAMQLCYLSDIIKLDVQLFKLLKLLNTF
jgi:hypothetical protein